MAREKLCGIYCIENLVNHKKYIGLSQDIEKRFKAHKNALNHNRHINRHLQTAWNMYGEKNFQFTIVELCDKGIVKEKEIYYIDMFKTQDRRFGYNKTSGGDGIKDLNAECADKISMSETLYPVVQLTLDGCFVCEYRNCRIAAESIGAKTENIRNCCNKKYGCKTISGYIWMYKFDYEQNGCCLEDYKRYRDLYKPVIQYDLNMNFIAEYESIHEADRITGIGYKMISRVCNGKRPHTHGFIFRFKDDSTIQN